ncbi:fluoride efflux transporter CrcB [Massilibacteroides sp.]|uniref:fluoride efflux transporter CrcB n=1 Tax=Massilibacteroides sp. TaxID=2034766 RepID=UPI002606EA1F|nr:fluoride efflux transporter CrcB [Massilibacteroides sp.]MDD4514479.1 fluoride efflux transporter CrcB [Massilibacteroides sp.]
MIKHLLLVTLGGGIGSGLRYLTTYWIMKQLPNSFPLSTFVVNILGCFAIGFLMGLTTRYEIFNNELRFLLIVGFCGGYTTFSTFSAENIKLIEMGHYGMAALYIATSILGGIAALWVGHVLSKILIS